MDTNIAIVIIQFITVLITIVSVTILYKTIINSKKLNQNIIFNEAVKQERELRIKLSEYREEIHRRIQNKKDFLEITLDHDTLLFNYYEYLAVCIYQKLVNEKIVRRYFKQPLISVKEKFDNSLLFKKKYAKKEEYPGIQWLFKKWKI